MINNERTNKTRVGIICAVEQEFAEFRRVLTDSDTITHAGNEILCGTLGNNEVAVMICGVGKVSAAIGAQAMIDSFSPDYIINSGNAGALSPTLDVYDIVVSEACVEHDMDTTELGTPAGYIHTLDTVLMMADKDVQKKILDAIPDSIHVEVGIIATGDQFISTNKQRHKILGNWPDAKVAEMEGAAIAHTCMQNKVPFCVLRCISDGANADSTVAYWEFAPIAGKRSAEILINMLKND